MATYTLSDSDWTAIDAGAASVLVQLSNQNPIRVTVAGAKPAANNESGIIMTWDNLRQLGFDVIPAGQNVYARAWQNTEAVIETIAV